MYILPRHRSFQCVPKTRFPYTQTATAMYSTYAVHKYVCIYAHIRMHTYICTHIQTLLRHRPLGLPRSDPDTHAFGLSVTAGLTRTQSHS